MAEQHPGYLPSSILHLRFKNAGSSNRRTAPFEGANAGAIPAPAATFGRSSFGPPGGEIESRLAYTQKSRGQNLPGRPLPRCITSSAPVSETGGPGAIPGEAANFVRRIYTPIWKQNAKISPRLRIPDFICRHLRFAALRCGETFLVFGFETKWSARSGWRHPESITS